MNIAYPAEDFQLRNDGRRFSRPVPLSRALAQAVEGLARRAIAEKLRVGDLCTANLIRERAGLSWADVVCIDDMGTAA